MYILGLLFSNCNLALIGLYFTYRAISRKIKIKKLFLKPELFFEGEFIQGIYMDDGVRAGCKPVCF